MAFDEIVSAITCGRSSRFSVSIGLGCLGSPNRYSRDNASSLVDKQDKTSFTLGIIVDWP